ncbi:uncharacterized protein LOC141947980 [Strix uralensis]|uniref:uncharacterized protein LOC141947980 n=1 Tax=Strix uralensis TaxID=36305 RepID=UPI003DA1F340
MPGELPPREGSSSPRAALSCFPGTVTGRRGAHSPPEQQDSTAKGCLTSSGAPSAERAGRGGKCRASNGLGGVPGRGGPSPGRGGGCPSPGGRAPAGESRARPWPGRRGRQTLAGRVLGDRAGPAAAAPAVGRGVRGRGVGGGGVTPGSNEAALLPQGGEHSACRGGDGHPCIWGAPGAGQGDCASPEVTRGELQGAAGHGEETGGDREKPGGTRGDEAGAGEPQQDFGGPKGTQQHWRKMGAPQQGLRGTSGDFGHLRRTPRDSREPEGEHVGSGGHWVPAGQHMGAPRHIGDPGVTGGDPKRNGQDQGDHRAQQGDPGEAGGHSGGDPGGYWEPRRCQRAFGGPWADPRGHVGGSRADAGGHWGSRGHRGQRDRLGGLC